MTIRKGGRYRAILVSETQKNILNTREAVLLNGLFLKMFDRNMLSPR
jgi:hypothetical protein